MEWTKEEEAELAKAEAKVPWSNLQIEHADRKRIAVASRAVELMAARGGIMDPVTLEQSLSGLERGTTTTAMVRQHIDAQGARIAALEADLEIATRKRPASFEMEKELSKALAERDDYRQKMLSEGGKFMAEMQRADRLADEAKGLREELAQWKRGSEVSFYENKATQAARQQEVEHRRRVEADLKTETRLHQRTRNKLQTMTDLRDGYRKAGALEHERAEKAETETQAWKAEHSAMVIQAKDACALSREQEARIESIRRRAAETSNLERLIAEMGLPAAMRWVLGDGCLVCGDSATDATPPMLCEKHEAEANERAGNTCDGVTCESDPPSDVGAGSEFNDRGEKRYPCSPTCTHDDASTPGHPERVKERSEEIGHPEPEMDPREVTAYEAGHAAGLEDMRAACLNAVQFEMEKRGASREEWDAMKSAIEGATP